MYKNFALFILVFGLAINAWATESKTRVGVDFALPYVLQIDGNSANTRANINLGLDGRYWIGENWNIGARTSFDIESRNNSTRQIAFAPGVQYFWLASEKLNPYVRFDLPVIFRGAASATGSNTQDVGIAGGTGVAWNFGETVGVENLAIRYDFNIQYTYGLGDALTTLGIEFVKVGIDYKF